MIVSSWLQAEMLQKKLFHFAASLKYRLDSIKLIRTPYWKIRFGTCQIEPVKCDRITQRLAVKSISIYSIVTLIRVNLNQII